MQQKISSFFKLAPSSPSTKRDPPPLPQDAGSPDDDGLDLWERTHNSFSNTYKRRSPSRRSGGSDTSVPGASKVLNKKRSYAQMFLELGQSDFNLRTCSICGIKYSPGDELDEKHHTTFHKNYTHGIPFKVFRNERVLVQSEHQERVVVVSDCDPLTLRNKMQEVIRMMEIELGDGWILRNLCKVYMFISLRRVAGCLVAEPVKEAFKVISSQVDAKFVPSAEREPRSKSATLKFGGIVFKRETTRKLQPAVGSVDVVDENLTGATVCKEEAVPAACGIRAIWVTPSNRRKHIASQLLDAARRSFCEGSVIEKADLAFSAPTSSGKALASRYTGTASFLVYKPD